MISLVSFLFTGSVDQSLVEGSSGNSAIETAKEAENWAGLLGAYVSNLLIFKGLGYSMLFVPLWFFDLGYGFIFKKKLYFIPNFDWKVVCLILWISVLFGNINFSLNLVDKMSAFSGAIGYEIAVFIHEMVGWGSWLFVGLSGFSIAVFAFRHPITG